MSVPREGHVLGGAPGVALGWVQGALQSPHAGSCTQPMKRSLWSRGKLKPKPAARGQRQAGGGSVVYGSALSEFPLLTSGCWALNQRP